MPAMVSTLLAAVFAGILLHMQGGVDAIQARAPAVIGGPGDKDMPPAPQGPPRGPGAMAPPTIPGEEETEQMVEEIRKKREEDEEAGQEVETTSQELNDAKNIEKEADDKVQEVLGQLYASDEASSSASSSFTQQQTDAQPQSSKRLHGPGDEEATEAIMQSLSAAHAESQEAAKVVEAKTEESKSAKKKKQEADKGYEEAEGRLAAAMEPGASEPKEFLQLNNSHSEAIGSVSSSFTQQQTDATLPAAVGGPADLDPAVAIGSVSSSFTQQQPDARPPAAAVPGAQPPAATRPGAPGPAGPGNQYASELTQWRTKYKIAEDKTREKEKLKRDLKDIDEGLKLTGIAKVEAEKDLENVVLGPSPKDLLLLQLNNSNDKAIGSASSSFTQQQPDAIGSASSSFTQQQQQQQQQQQPDATPAAPDAARPDRAASPATPTASDAAAPVPAAPQATGKRLMRSEGKPAVETAQDVQPRASEPQPAAVLEVVAEDRMTAEASRPGKKVGKA